MLEFIDRYMLGTLDRGRLENSTLEEYLRRAREYGFGAQDVMMRTEQLQWDRL
jgi:hypothetical protein